jgi:hypothetical protein
LYTSIEPLQQTNNKERLEKTNMSANMIQLASGTLELENNSWQHLRRVLEMILPHWLDSTILGGKGIQLFLLQDSDVAECGKPEEFPPIAVLRAFREGVAPLKIMHGYVLLAEMQYGIHPDPLMDKLQRIFDDATCMKDFWQDEKRHVAEPKLGQGDGSFRAYKIVFSTAYHNTFLRIFLSHIYTPA